MKFLTSLPPSCVLRVANTLFTISTFLFHVPSSLLCIIPFLFYIIPSNGTINKFTMTNIYPEPRKDGGSFSHSLRCALRLNNVLFGWLKSKMKNNPLRHAVHINYSGRTKADRDGGGCGTFQWKRTPGQAMAPLKSSCLQLLAQKMSPPNKNRRQMRTHTSYKSVFLGS